MNITKEVFHAWLKNNPKDRVFDLNHGCRCAVCMFLLETTNYKQVLSGTKHSQCYLEPILNKVTMFKIAPPLEEIINWEKWLVDVVYGGTMPGSKEMLLFQKNLVTIEEILQRFEEKFPEFKEEEKVENIEEKELVLA